MTKSIENTDIEESWENIRTTITKANKPIIGGTERKRKKYWHDEECENSMKTARIARSNLLMN